MLHIFTFNGPQIELQAKEKEEENKGVSLRLAMELKRFLYNIYYYIILLIALYSINWQKGKICRVLSSNSVVNSCARTANVR